MTTPQLLRATADRIESAADYRWQNPAACNVGLLIEVARGQRATPDEFFAGGGPAVNGCRLWSNRRNHVTRWLEAEFDLNAADLSSIELLNDARIIRALHRRGIEPAPMFNRSRRYVAAYLRLLAEKIHRRGRTKKLAAVT